MRKVLFLVFACLAAAVWQPRAAQAQGCYHCAYDSQGNAFCHPITISGGSTGCGRKVATEILPSDCTFSGGSCSSALNVTSDGRALAANAPSAPGAGDRDTMRRSCDGAIVDRKYQASIAQELRASSRDLRV